MCHSFMCLFGALTEAAMLPAQYSSRFVPLLNMLADDVTRTPSPDFPMTEPAADVADSGGVVHKHGYDSAELSHS